MLVKFLSIIAFLLFVTPAFAGEKKFVTSEFLCNSPESAMMIEKIVTRSDLSEEAISKRIDLLVDTGACIFLSVPVLVIVDDPLTTFIDFAGSIVSIHPTTLNSKKVYIFIDSGKADQV